MWPSDLTDDLQIPQGASSVLLQTLCIISKPSVDSNCGYSGETLNLVQNRRFFGPCDLEISQMPWTFNREPLPCRWANASIICKPSVNSNWSYIPETFNLSQNRPKSIFLSVWPWNLLDALKTMVNFFYIITSFVHHFVAIVELKLEL